MTHASQPSSVPGSVAPGSCPYTGAIDATPATAESSGGRDVIDAPGAWPLLGHIVPILRDPLGFLPGLAQYGDVVRIRFGRLPVYVVTDPDSTRDVLVPGDVDYMRGLCFEKLEPGL